MAKVYTHLYIVFTLCLLSLPSVAAPFCVTFQRGVSPECIYYDIAQCRRDADVSRGRCTVDMTYMESVMQFRLVGSGRFCLVHDQSFISCMYQVREDCVADASAGEDGLCFDKENFRPIEEIAESKKLLQQESVLSGVDALGAGTPHSSSFDPLAAFNVNINNKGAKLNLND